jgi:hypothetical protein
MNQKVSFSQHEAYLTKVKKEKPTKGAAKPFATESVLEQRQEKLNFKQYLSDLKVQQASDDEYGDIAVLSLSKISLESIRDTDDSLIETLRVFDFGGDEAKLKIVESDWHEIKTLEREASIYVDDEFGDQWYVTRTSNNILVLECLDQEFNGKLEFDAALKKLK